MDPEYMTSSSDEEVVMVARYFLLRLERKRFLHSFIQATQLSPAWRGPFAATPSIGVETGAILYYMYDLGADRPYGGTLLN